MRVFCIVLLAAGGGAALVPGVPGCSAAAPRSRTTRLFAVEFEKLPDSPRDELKVRFTRDSFDAAFKVNQPLALCQAAHGLHVAVYFGKLRSCRRIERLAAPLDQTERTAMCASPPLQTAEDFAKEAEEAERAAGKGRRRQTEELLEEIRAMMPETALEPPPKVRAATASPRPPSAFPVNTSLRLPRCPRERVLGPPPLAAPRHGVRRRLTRSPPSAGAD